MYALVFDFGGVLMKTVTREPRYAWDDRLGLPRGTVERIVHGSDSWHKAQLGVITVDEYRHDVARLLGLPIAEMGQMEVDFFSGDSLDHSLIDFIAARKAAGQPVALLSNDSTALRDKLKALNIADLFDPLLISAELGVMKPEPAAYERVIERLRVPPGRAVFVDDMPVNVEGARLAGMIGIRYTPDIDLPNALLPYM